jgi:hypothetical protein
MHFGNALLIGLVTFMFSKNKLIKWSVLFYPFLVLFVIVVTANHFYMDAIIGGLVVLFPYPIMYFKRSRYKKLKLIYAR